MEGNPINQSDPTGLIPLQSGYVEGDSWAAGVGEGDIYGKEIVYDYATMTRASFVYSGNVGGLFASIGASAYLGRITGFRYEPKPLPIGLNSFPDLPHTKLIIDDYGGYFDGWYAGVSPLPYSTGGIGAFHSTDQSIQGRFSYVSLGEGLIPFEVVGFHTFYKVDISTLPGYQNTGIEYYYDTKTRKVNRAKLIADILTGNHSPIHGGILASTISWVASNRNGEIATALIAANRFEDYYYQSEYGQCNPNHLDPKTVPPLPSPFNDPFHVPYQN